MAMTQAQIDEFNRIRANQNDLAAAKWADSQGIAAPDYVAVFQNYPVKNNPAVTAADIPDAGGAISDSASLQEPEPVVAAPASTPALEIPHPEEQPDYSRNIHNISFPEVLHKWFTIYQVPEQYRTFWQHMIAVSVRTDISYPAGTWEQDGIRHLAVRPEWLNPGVIAHEQAHNSYALLTARQKADFSAVYGPLKVTSPLIKLLYSKNTYGLTNDIEGHAEVYRYLGEKMPAQLKPYYPKLF